MEHDVMYRSKSLRRLYYEADGVSPHTETTRATYTAPTNTYATINNMYFLIMRATAPNTAGTFYIRAQLLIGGTEIINLGAALSRTASVGGLAQTYLPCNILLRPGDQVRITTYDDSVGGSVNYSGWISIVEHF